MAPTDYQQQVMAAVAECGDTVRDGALDTVKMWIKNDDDKTKTDAKYEGALCYLEGLPGTDTVAFGILGVGRSGAATRARRRSTLSRFQATPGSRQHRRAG